MHPVSCTNTHHEVTVMINREMLKIQDLKCFENGTELSYEVKQFLTCTSDDTF